MNTDTKFAVLEKASSQTAAQIVKGLLESAGIPTYIGGEFLSDEFAMSQKLVGHSGVVIEVPADRLEEARYLVQQARNCGESLAEQEWNAENS